MICRFMNYQTLIPDLKVTLIEHLISLFVITISAYSNYCLIKKKFDLLSKRTLHFCTESYEIKFSQVTYGKGLL